MTLRNTDLTGAKAQGYPMDHSFGALAPSGAVGHRWTQGCPQRESTAAFSPMYLMHFDTNGPRELTLFSSLCKSLWLGQIRVL